MRNRVFGIIGLIGLWGWCVTVAQTVTISGGAPEYAGKAIQLSVPGHPFLQRPLFSETIVCDDRGSFRTEVEVASGILIRLEAGIHDAGLYVEPGKTYEVVLPAYKELVYADRLSPYFEPIRIPLKVSGDSRNVNNELFRFDSLFSILNDQLILWRRMGKVPPADSIIDLLSSSFPGGTTPWFEDYRRYKNGILILNAGRTGLETISREFLGPVVKETHPAFVELFGAMFKDFLIYFDRTAEGTGIRHHINRTHHLDSLRNIMIRHPAILNDTLADLILLQELPSLFYRGDFHKEAILILLDSMVANPVKPIYSTYAQQLRNKLASLVVGYPPPEFSLEGTDGLTWSPADFKGKYTYLMFCTPDHYGCMMEYPFLSSYHLKHSDYLEIVTIMVAEKREQVHTFMVRNDYPWKALYYMGRDGILDDYLVKAFPVAYLIGPDGNLVLSPAPLPSDGFEQQLFRIMRSRGEI